jgi:outer membrane protein TolC
VLTYGAANVTEHDIARRAYDLYLARDHQHGHDLDDWLQAERELRDSRRSTHTKRP